MSRQLSRIRSLMNEMEQIQREGQKSALPFAAADPFPMAEVLPLPASPENPSEEEAVTKKYENLAVGKVAIQLTGNVVVQLEIQETTEVIEVRRLENAIEIRFADGKAVHLPLKNVA